MTIQKTEIPESPKIFPPQGFRLMPLVDSVHWHFSPWIDKWELWAAGANFVLANEEALTDVSDLDKVVRAYLESVARDEKAKVLGYAPSDEQFYTPMVVAKLLPIALELEDALQPSYDPEADHRGGGDYGEFVASLLDVRRAWINSAFRNSEMAILKRRFVEDQDWTFIAATLGMEMEEVQKQATRGLRRMVNFLGGTDPRKVVKQWQKN